MRFGMIVGDPRIRSRFTFAFIEERPSAQKARDLEHPQRSFRLDGTDLHQFHGTQGTRNGEKNASLRLSLHSAVTRRDNSGFDRRSNPAPFSRDINTRASSPSHPFLRLENAIFYSKWFPR